MKSKSKFCASFFLAVFIFSLISPAALFARGSMRVVYSENFAPFSWGSGKDTRGILIDVMNEAAKRVGVALVHEAYPWGRAQLMVMKEGKADAFVTIATPLRRDYTKVADEPVISVNMVPFTYVGHRSISEFNQATSLQDFKSYRIIDYFGNGWGDTNLVGFNRHQVMRLNDVLQMIAEQKGDLCIGNNFVIGYTLKEMGLTDKVVQIPLPLEGVSYSLCIGNNSPYVNRLADFSAALKELRESGEMEKIYDKYR